MNTDLITPRMMKRLSTIAAQYAHDPMDADDILSEMLEAILRLCGDADSTSRIFTKARWVALNHVRNARIYTKYVGTQSETEAVHEDEDGDEEVDFIADDLTPEQMVEERQASQALELALLALDATDQQVVRMLKQGFIAAEIARSMKVSRAAISFRMTRIARQLSSMGFAPSAM